MKSHITNSYGGYSNDLQMMQKRVAKIAKSLDFYEMGVYQYPVESDTPEMLNRRLDGMIASLEQKDVVYVQLPTGNGWEYESRFLQHLKVYEARLALLIEAPLDTIDAGLLNTADLILVYSQKYLKFLVSQGVDEDKCMLLSLKNSVAENTINASLMQINNYFENDIFNDDNYYEDTIHLCMGLHDPNGLYSRSVGIVMKSLLDHTDAHICFHIFIDDTVSFVNRFRLRSIATQYGSMVSFHLIDSSVFDQDNPSIQYFTVGTMFRLLIPEVLKDLSKVIYIDADLLVLKDIRLLWEEDASDYALIAVGDRDIASGIVRHSTIEQGIIPADRYFNAGVLVMNLDKIRNKGNLVDLVSTFLAEHPSSEYPDQDALNYYFLDETKLIDSSWNCFTSIARRNGFPFEENIYHFAGELLNCYEGEREWDRILLEYKFVLPWPNKDTVDELFRVSDCTFDHVFMWQKCMHELWNTKKNIIYCGEECLSMSSLNEIISIRDNDIWIRGNDDSSMLRVRELIETDRESYVLFIEPEAFNNKVLSLMDELDLQKGRDYFEIPALMTDRQGGYLM